MFKRISEQYQNSIAVVIGAGGIGGAIVQLLSGHVSKLVVGDRDQRLLDALTPQAEPNWFDTALMSATRLPFAISSRTAATARALLSSCFIRREF